MVVVGGEVEVVVVGGLVGVVLGEVDLSGTRFKMY